jgi:hypothetical protein
VLKKPYGGNGMPMPMAADATALSRLIQPITLAD